MVNSETQSRPAISEVAHQSKTQFYGAKLVEQVFNKVHETLIILAAR